MESVKLVAMAPPARKKKYAVTFLLAFSAPRLNIDEDVSRDERESLLQPPCNSSSLRMDLSC
jgi:hypothetical protein